MKIAIIGGKLQGTEAVFLTREAGFESILIDSNPDVPASGLADRFVCGDVIAGDPEVIAAMEEADMVLPCNENDELLTAVCNICREKNLKLAFDPDAYDITKSKAASDALMHDHGIPAPRYFPEGKAPYIIKPSGESGSAGVRKADSQQAVEDFLADCEYPEGWVIQEYLEGPSYSIEVIGVPGNYRTYAVTQIHMDQVYDCCKVTAPCLVGESGEKRFDEIGRKLAELVNLHGIMDVEVIDDGEDLKVLEIDARLPSQTPIAVLKCSGMNYVRELADIVCHGEFQTRLTAPVCYSVYEHYRRKDGHIVQEGEHMMAEARPLALRENFCSAQVVMTDYDGAGSSFRGIFVCWDESAQRLEQRCRQVNADLKRLP